MNTATFPAHAIGALINQLPSRVLSDLRSRGLDDAAIEQLSPREAFAYYCQWNGLINWSDTLWEVVTALRTVQVQTGEHDTRFRFEVRSEESSYQRVFFSPADIPGIYLFAYAKLAESGEGTYESFPLTFILTR